MATTDLDVTGILAATGWTGATVANLSTSNDVRATDGQAGEFISADLDNAPGDFAAQNSIQLKAEARISGAGSRTKQMLMELRDSADNILQSHLTGDLTTSDVVYSTPVWSRSDSQAVIDGYRFRITIQEGGGMPDSVVVDIDRMWGTLDYLLAAEYAANASRWYEDDAGEASSTPLAAQDTDVSVDTSPGNVQAQLRLRVDETAGGTPGSGDRSWQLQYSKNSGAYTDVTGSSSNVKATSAGSSLTDGANTTNRSTNGISDPGTGSFIAGEQEANNGLIEDDPSAVSFNNFTEHVFALTFIAADLSDSDTLDFRLLFRSSPITAGVTPRATISAGAGTTPVSQASDFRRAIDARALDSLTLVRAIDASVADQVDLRRELFASAAQSVDIRRALDASVVRALDLRREMEGAVEAALSLVRALDVHAERTVDLRREVFAAVETSTDLRRAIDQEASLALDLRRALDASVEQSSELRRALDVQVLAASDLARAIDTSASADAELRRALDTAAAASADLRRTVEQPASAAVDLRRALDAAVTTDIDLRRALFQTAAAAIDLSRAVDAAVAADIDLRREIEGVSGTVSAALDLRRALDARVAAATDLARAVDQPVTADSDLRRAIHVSASKALGLVRALDAAVSQATDIRRAVEARTARQIDILRAVDATVATAADLRRQVLSRAGRDLDLRRAVDEAAGKTVELRRALDATVAVATDLRREIGASVVSAERFTVNVLSPERVVVSADTARLVVEVPDIERIAVGADIPRLVVDVPDVERIRVDA